jgi:hypothetical protein
VQDALHRLRTGYRPEIAIISASYGLNCRKAQTWPPFVNSAAEGNAAKPIKQICNGTDLCQLRVDVAMFGDPVNGCAKDFSVQYR